MILYRNASDKQTYLRDTLVVLSDRKLADAHYSTEEQGKLIHSCMNMLIDESARRGFSGNLWHTFLALLLVSDENAYSMSDEKRGDTGGSIRELALHDLKCFKRWFDIDFSEMIKRLCVPEFSVLFDYKVGSSESKVFNTRVRDRICELAKDLAGCDSAEDMLSELALFYKHYGVGKFGLHKAFRVRHKEPQALIEPIRNIRHVQLSDLVGYEIAKQKLVENTEAFVSGKKANNCLLYGDAGTGKSSCIKAIANEYFDKGLRIIEIYKHQFKDLNDVIAQIKGRNYKFIIYMDDLSFEEFETDYKYLKAVIEGGLEKKPENVLIYATSNRRHLIRESFKDKPAVLDDDLHRNDTVQEKLSLANRFGVTIYFGAPEMKEYDEIVRVLARRNGIDMEGDELIAEARKWEMNHGGLSGRTAQQFIDYLLGK
ncbi:ATP-binding protein [Butyrivibrio sp. AE3004]|uniref:ATP-binding protein n=1 Tax=Butyrivibrio sp. AE3004 TaxID=1506994 RepID=UPI000494451F